MNRVSTEGYKDECLWCEKEIPNPKEDQKFCCPKCRYAYHNRLKNTAFAKELLALLKKYRVLDLERLNEEKKHQGI